MSLSKILREYSEDYDINPSIGYHVTSKNRLNNIKKKGLIPKIPEDYGDSGDVEGIYFFKSRKHAEDAMMGWFGERIEEWEEENDKDFNEILLVVDLSEVNPTNIIDGGEDQFEWIVSEVIPYKQIIKIEDI